MYVGKKILAVVPARGGSKGIPQKNIKLLQGRPLIDYTADLLLSMPEIDRALVSTDSKEIATIAKSAGLSFYGYRPEELSGDRVPDLPVLRQALDQAEEKDQVSYDIILMMQPTSPIRKIEDIRSCIHKLVDQAYDAVWTLTPADIKFHPLKLLSVDGGDANLYDEGGKKVIARQELKQLYYRNGICYAFTRQCILDQQTIYGEKLGAVIVDHAIVNIDTLEDFAKAESLI